MSNPTQLPGWYEVVQFLGMPGRTLTVTLDPSLKEAVSNDARYLPNQRVFDTNRRQEGTPHMRNILRANISAKGKHLENICKNSLIYLSINGALKMDYPSTLTTLKIFRGIVNTKHIAGLQLKVLHMIGCTIEGSLSDLVHMHLEDLVWGESLMSPKNLEALPKLTHLHTLVVTSKINRVFPLDVLKALPLKKLIIHGRYSGLNALIDVPIQTLTLCHHGSMPDSSWDTLHQINSLSTLTIKAANINLKLLNNLSLNVLTLILPYIPHALQYWVSNIGELHIETSSIYPETKDSLTLASFRLYGEKFDWGN